MKEKVPTYLVASSRLIGKNNIKKSYCLASAGNLKCGLEAKQKSSAIIFFKKIHLADYTGWRHVSH